MTHPNAGPAIDLTGQVFGRLTAIEHVTSKGWRCRCECGTIKIVPGGNLRSGMTRSCGCLRRDLLRQRGSLPRRREDLPDRKSAERRVRYERGPVGEQVCARCPREGRHWALQRITAHYRSEGQAPNESHWSLDPADYDPLCAGHNRGRNPNRRANKGRLTLSN